MKYLLPVILILFSFSCSPKPEEATRGEIQNQTPQVLTDTDELSLKSVSNSKRWYGANILEDLFNEGIRKQIGRLRNSNENNDNSINNEELLEKRIAKH